jgi:hypothetical protein
MRFVTVALISGLASLMMPAWSQTIKPGLWEITSKIGGNTKSVAEASQMQALVANMKPDERKGIEDMLARQGIKMGTGPDAGAMIVQTCITPVMAAHHKLLVGQRGNCSSKISNRSTTGMMISFKCSDPTSSGQGRVSVTSNVGYTMKMKIKTAASGQPESMMLDGNGQWIAVACGDIRVLPAAEK